MGRKPKTLAELKASGAISKNPQRYREREEFELQPEVGIGPAPEEFSRQSSDLVNLKLQAWNELVSGVPDGVLTKMDRPYMITLSRLYAQTMRNGATGRDHKRFIDALKEAPFTPKARAGFAIRRQKAADQANRNPFSKFAQAELPPRVQ